MRKYYLPAKQTNNQQMDKSLNLKAHLIKYYRNILPPFESLFLFSVATKLVKN
mgnify:CR=1 FL=1